MNGYLLAGGGGSTSPPCSGTSVAGDRSGGGFPGGEGGGDGGGEEGGEDWGGGAGWWGVCGVGCTPPSVCDEVSSSSCCLEDCDEVAFSDVLSSAADD